VDVLVLAIAQTNHPGPIPEINCPDPPQDPCIAGPAPTIEFIGGEEALLRVTAAAEDDDGVGDVIETKLVVYKKNANGTFIQHYTVTTNDAAQLGYQRDGSTQDFLIGVPGIDKDGEYQASVGFCYDYQNPPPAPFQNRFCECESAPVLLNSASLGWAVVSPSPPRTIPRDRP